MDIMKRIGLTMLGLLLTGTVFAIKVNTEVYEVIKDEEGKNCCYKMVHLLYTDDDVFLTYGFSNMGSCCPGQGVQINGSHLSPAIQAELMAFFNTSFTTDIA